MKRLLGKPQAAALIKGGIDAPMISGEVDFYQKQGVIFIMADISGLPSNKSGFFGFHIHEGNVCSGNEFESTGSHYNPSNMPHPMHAGDLLPLINCKGNAFLAFITDRFTLSEIIGKTVVIHNKSDDFTTQPAGNAGNKIACGVIRSL